MKERETLDPIARLAIVLGVVVVAGWMLVRAFEGLSAESRAFLFGAALGALGVGAPLVAALALLRRSYHAEIAALRARLDAAHEEVLRAQQAMWHQAVGREIIARIAAPTPAPPPSSYGYGPQPYSPPSLPPKQADDVAEWPEE